MVSTSALAHGLSKLLAVPEEVSPKDDLSKTPRCASRSTSVGSSSSNAHSSGLESASPCDIQSPEPGFCAARDWAPVVVRNTFLDAPPGIPQSLMGFFHEREIHSCPASGIGAPPGLKAPAETTSNEAAAAVVAEATEAKFTAELHAGSPMHCASDSLGLPEYDYPVPFGFAATPESTPKIKSSFDGFFFQPNALRSCPNSEFSMAGLSGIGELSPKEDPKVQTQNVAFAGAPQRPPALPPVNLEAAYLAQLVETLRAENEMLRASLHTGGTKEAIVACPEVASGPPAPIHPAPMARAPLFLEHSLTPPPPAAQADSYVLPQVQRKDSEKVATPPPQQPSSGSPTLPSVGSAGHYAGECKPCVHFWKKGCANGVECPFCHLCDADEVKRRQSKKASFRKRAALQADRYQGGTKKGLGFSGRC